MAWGGGNIYRFAKDNVNFILMPLKGNSQPKARKAGGKAFLTITQSLLEIQRYLKEMKKYML